MTSRTQLVQQMRRAEDPSAGVFIAVLGSAIACLIYLLTLSNGLGWHDAAELALRAEKLGATHSPGSPLHTVLGWIFTRFTDSPATGTNLLSALSTGTAAGMLAMLAWQTSGRLAYATALLFACGFQVWANAVITELYGLSALFCMLSCVLLWQWHMLKQTVWLVLGVVAYGLALASWFANLLFAPALLWLIYMDRRRIGGDILIVVGVISAAIISIVLANIWLAGRLLPHGPDIPDSLTGIIRYMGGAMHEPLAVRDFNFLTGRMLEHVRVFSSNFFWIGVPLGLLGVYLFVKRDLAFGGYLVGIFVIQMGYFTFFGADDYFTMVVLSYAIFSFWIVHGVVQLISKYPWLQLPAIIILAGIPVLQVLSQLPNRVEASRISQAQRYVEQSFSLLPENALVIAGWREFTVLEYAQQIQGQRADLQIILPAMTIRFYDGQPIDNYLDLVDASYCGRPIFTNKRKDELLARYRLDPVGAGANWHRLIDEQAACDAHQE